MATDTESTTVSVSTTIIHNNIPVFYSPALLISSAAASINHNMRLLVASIILLLSLEPHRVSGHPSSSDGSYSSHEDQSAHHVQLHHQSKKGESQQLERPWPGGARPRTSSSRPSASGPSSSRIVLAPVTDETALPDLDRLSKEALVLRCNSLNILASGSKKALVTRLRSHNQSNTNLISAATPRVRSTIVRPTPNTNTNNNNIATPPPSCLPPPAAHEADEFDHEVTSPNRRPSSHARRHRQRRQIDHRLRKSRLGGHTDLAATRQLVADLLANGLDARGAQQQPQQQQPVQLHLAQQQAAQQRQPTHLHQQHAAQLQTAHQAAQLIPADPSFPVHLQGRYPPHGAEPTLHPSQTPVPASCFRSTLPQAFQQQQQHTIQPQVPASTHMFPYHFGQSLQQHMPTNQPTPNHSNLTTSYLGVPAGPLPAVPQAVLDKIRRGEFVSFEALLPQPASHSVQQQSAFTVSFCADDPSRVSVQPSSSLADPSATSSGRGGQGRNKVSDPRWWFLAWSLFLSVMLVFHAHLVPQLVRYQSTIARYFTCLLYTSPSPRDS